MADVDLVGVEEGVRDASVLVKHFHLRHPFGHNGEFARGGVGVDAQAFGVDDMGDAHMVNGELQRDDAVASCLGLSLVYVFAALGQHLAVPLIAVGGSVHDGGVAAVVDGDVQRHRAVAASGIGEGDRVDSGGRVDGIVPGVAVTGRDIFYSRCAVVDSEVKGDSAVAAYGIES